MILDCHGHLFPLKVIASVCRKQGLARSLGLNTQGAEFRTNADSLSRSLRESGVSACLVLPTAPAGEAGRANQACRDAVSPFDNLIPGGTVHPEDSSKQIDRELERLAEQSVRALKLCSFSQGFDLRSEALERLLERVEHLNRRTASRFFFIFDTFAAAGRHFHTPQAFITTPERLGSLVRKFPGLSFVAAHMGGLAASFQEIVAHLPPQPHLYLDTSNASHTLEETEFLRLLERHGPRRILFGTDWPWFPHGPEIARIEGLLRKAGFDHEDRERIFSGNAAELLGRPRA